MANLPRRASASRSGWVFAVLALFVARPASAQRLAHRLTVPLDGTVIGELSDVDVTPDGEIVALDIQSDVVFVFAPDGSLARRLGGEGEGPGEILLGAEVEVGPAGEVLIADARNRRLTLWSPNGELVGSGRFDALFGPEPRWPHDLIWNSAGVFLKMSQFIPDRPVDVFSVPADLRSRGEKVASIPVGDRAATCTFCPIAMDPAGRLLAAAGDTLYVVAAMNGDGAVTTTWTRSDLPAVRRSEGELERRRSRARRLAGTERGGSGEHSDGGDFKPRFGPHGIGVDAAGRVWTAPAVGDDEPGFFDVFEPDGRLIVTIRMDAPVNGFRIRGDWLVVASETPLGEPVVRLYSIDTRP